MQEKSDNRKVYEAYMGLNQPKNCILLTYVWIDGSMQNLRSKTRTVNSEPKTPEDCPIWNFDGSSTNQAFGDNSDVYLKPIAIFKDPFLRENNKLVLCEIIDFDLNVHKTNSRRACCEAMKKAAESKPWFGIEQEYSLLGDDGRPLCWPKNGFPKPQGSYYCGVGPENSFGRYIVDSHYKACMYAGVKICGTNAEVMASQWEFQVGPSEGIDAGDHLWMARYILFRVAEDFGVRISFDPKIISSKDWNGAGAHTNYSTAEMRNKDGIKNIERAIEKLSLKHEHHILNYDPNQGEDNKRRLTGNCETSSMNNFSSGVANRGASIRIPRQVAHDGFGYLEDRRPASNCDPYVVTRLLVETTILN